MAVKGTWPSPVHVALSSSLVTGLHRLFAPVVGRRREEAHYILGS